MNEKKPINSESLQIAINSANDQKFLDRHPGDLLPERNIADLTTTIVDQIKTVSNDSKSLYKNLMTIARRLELTAGEYQRQFFIKGEIYSGEFEEKY